MLINMKELLRCLRLLGFLIFLPLCAAEVFWAFVPDRPVLHPVPWQSPEIKILNNDTDLLGPPAIDWLSNHSVSFNYTGQGQGTPLCFGKKTEKAGCVNLTAHTYLYSGTQVVRLPLPTPRGMTPTGDRPHSFPSCGEETEETTRASCGPPVLMKQLHVVLRLKTLRTLLTGVGYKT